MVGIKMSRNDDLEPVSPKFLRQPYTDDVRRLRRQFLLFEALIAVDRNDTSLLIISFFYFIELFFCCISLTVAGRGVGMDSCFHLVI